MKLLLSIVLAVFLVGCSSVGNEQIKTESQETIEDKLISGVTTKQQVKELFGDPMDATFHPDGSEMWKYVFTKTSCNFSCYFIYTAWAYRSSSGTAKTLTILFNDNDTVRKHTLSESPVESKSGIFAG